MLQHSKKIIFFFVIWLLISLAFIPKLELIYDFESFFPKNNPDLDFYLDYRKKFEPDDNFIFIALVNQPTVFNEQFLNQAHLLSQQLGKLSYVEEVISLTDFKYPIKTPFGWNGIKALHIDKPALYEKDSFRMISDSRIAGKLVAKDAQSLNVVLKVKYPLTQKEEAVLHQKIDTLLQQSKIKEYHMVGRIPVQTAFVNKNLEEMLFYTLLSGALVFLVLLFIYKRLIPVFIAFGTVIISLILFLGTLALLGIKLNFMAQLFPILMLIVGMSDIIHLLERYQEELHKGETVLSAMQIALKEIALALFLTSFTTTIGFLALVTSNIVPISQFGYKAALGVVIAWLTAIFFTPAILLFFTPKQIIHQGSHLPFLDKLLIKIYTITKYNKSWVLSTTIICLLLSIWGITTISTDAKLKNDIPKDEKMMSDYVYFENHYGGFRSFEIAVLPKQQYTITDKEIISITDSIQQFIVRNKYANFLTSPADLYKTTNCAMNGNSLSFYKLPDDSNFVLIQKEVKKIPKKITGVLVNENENIGRISGKSDDVGSDANTLKYAAIQKWIDQYIDTNKVQIKFTGTALLIDQNNGYLIKSLFYGLALAFTVISIVMMLLYRNWKMVIVSLVPNIVPLLIAGGIIGWMNIVLDAATSIIFTIAFGIAVDDTLHFLSRFKIEKQKGLSTDEAIYITLTLTGKAMILTTVILFSGFLLLTFSDFSGTFRVGFLISITLLIALLADLFLLPVLIRVFKI